MKMNEYIPSKTHITQVVLKQLPDTQRIEFRDAMNLWWYFRRTSSGLRLTEIGDRVFQLAEIEYANCPFKLSSEDQNWTKILLEINNKLACPYFIYKGEGNKPYIRLYDTKIAMMVTLYDDIGKYINNVKLKRY